MESGFLGCPRYKAAVVVEIGGVLRILIGLVA